MFNQSLAAIVLSLLLSLSCLAQSVFTQGQHVRVRWHGQWRSAIMQDNPRMTDVWTEVRFSGRKFKCEAVALEDVRARR
jgi:hypothetical protein